MSVIHLAERQFDNRLWTVEQMLEDALGIARDKEQYKHGLVLLMVEDGLIDPHWWAANLKVTQIMGATEALKARMMHALIENGSA